MTTKNTVEFHYKCKTGLIPVSQMTEEHLIRAIKSSKSRSDDHYVKSLDLAKVYSSLIEEYERRHPDIEDVEKYLKEKNPQQVV